MYILGDLVTKDTGILTNVETVPTSQQRRATDNSLITNYGGGPITTYSFQNHIVYTRTSKANRQQSNLCRHTRNETRYSGNVNNMVYMFLDNPGVINDSYFNDYSHHTVSAGAHSSAVTNSKTSLGGYFGTTLLEGSGQAYINQAFADLRPDLTSLSLPNFLLEIGDIKKMFQLWKRSAGLARNAAGAHLNYNFGWKPFLGDLLKLKEAVYTLKQKILDFENGANCLFHRSKVMLDTEDTAKGDFAPGSEQRTFWTATVKRKVTAHIVYRPCVPSDVRNLRLGLGTILESLGFELNPRILWDALPFTFVLDWFFDVGGLLSQYRIDTVQLPIKLVDCYLQYKEEFTCESNTQICYGRSDISPWARSGGWVTKTSFFYRLPIMPDYSTLKALGWRIPTGRQALLGLSLATVLSNSR